MKMTIIMDFINHPEFFKYNTSKTGCYFTIGHNTGKDPTQLDSLETANLNYQTMKDVLSRIYILLMSNTASQ
jgi:hypothetical protein